MPEKKEKKGKKRKRQRADDEDDKEEKKENKLQRVDVKENSIKKDFEYAKKLQREFKRELETEKLLRFEDDEMFALQMQTEEDEKWVLMI